MYQHTRKFRIEQSRGKKNESDKTECGMQWWCCYACGCYCCSVCIVWWPDVNQSQMNVRYSINTGKKPKSIQLKKTRGRLVVCAQAHFLSLTLCVVHFISICLSDHSFFSPIPSIDLMDVYNRQTRSIAHKFPGLFMCQTKVALKIYANPKRIQHSTAHSAHTQMFISRIEYFAEIDKLKTRDNPSRKVSSKFLNSRCSNDFDAFA